MTRPRASRSLVAWWISACDRISPSSARKSRRSLTARGGIASASTFPWGMDTILSPGGGVKDVV
jgi:hypothetical protein